MAERRSSHQLYPWNFQARERTRMSDPLVVAHPLPPGPAVQPQKFSVASILPVHAV
jgi:hypothetical protein